MIFNPDWIASSLLNESKWTRGHGLAITVMTNERLMGDALQVSSPTGVNFEL